MRRDDRVSPIHTFSRSKCYGTPSTTRFIPDCLLIGDKRFNVLSAFHVFDGSFSFDGLRTGVYDFEINEAEWSFRSGVFAETIVVLTDAAVEVITLPDIKRKILQTLKDVDVAFG